jgi:Tol biopolymer transport system component
LVTKVVLSLISAALGRFFRHALPAVALWSTPASAAQDPPSSDTVRAWVRELGDENPDKRDAAGHRLAEHIERVEDLVIAAARDPDPERSGRAKALLAKLDFVRAPKLAFVYGDGEIYHLYVMRLPQGELVRLTAENAFCASPAWSRDGRYLAYSRRQASGTDLWVHDFMTGKQSQITRNGRSFEPRWSPIDQAILHVREGETEDALCVTNPRGTSLRELSRSKQKLKHPEWSPDGKKVLYVKGGTLVCSAASGENPVDLATDLGVARPRWEADGRSIACADRSAVILVGVNGGKATTLLKLAENSQATSIAFSPDGKSVVWVAGPETGRRIWLRVLESGEQLALGDEGLNPSEALLAPDLKTVYFVAYDYKDARGAGAGHFNLYRQSVGDKQVKTLSDGKACAAMLSVFLGASKKEW